MNIPHTFYEHAGIVFSRVGKNRKKTKKKVFSIFSLSLKNAFFKEKFIFFLT
jgi:predicted transcriptional regulator